MNSMYKEFGPKTPVVNNGPFSYLQQAMNRANQIMQTINNPQQFVLQSFGNIPTEIQNNPDQILRYLQENNMLSPQQLQALSMLRSK